MTAIQAATSKTNTHAAVEPTQQGLDPLREFIDQLPPQLLDPSTRVAFPVAPSFATSYGSSTLEEFAALKIREANDTLLPNESEYGRYGTPITKHLEHQLATLDQGEAALVFSSGMAAIETVIDAVLPTSGSEKGHLIVADEGYRQTSNILARMESRGWIELTRIPTSDFVDVGRYLQKNTKAILFETPSNPYLRTIDIRKVREQVDEAHSSARIVVDHTFSSPINQRPLEQGADLVIPSLTKYIGGRNEVIGGAIIGSRALLKEIATFRGQKGNILSDADALRVEEGLSTLPQRMHCLNRNGQHVAELLARHPQVDEVWYPGLTSHPDHPVAKAQMSGFGGVVTFTVRANDFCELGAFSNALVRNLEGAFIAPSFGSENALLSVVTVVSHFTQSLQERAARNIPFNLLRLSVGTGAPEELTEALKAAFAALES